VVTFRESGPDLTDEQLRRFEATHGISLPKGYREFLLRVNGGRPTPDVIDVDGAPAMPTDVQVLFGIDHPMRSSQLGWNRETFADRLEEALMPIARDSGGSLFCLVLSGRDGGAVVYWDTNGGGAVYSVAHSFDEFLDRFQPAS
jgi:hypothetical protein